MSIAAVQSRIAELNAQFVGVVPAAATPSTTPTLSTASATNEPSFTAVLDAAQARQNATAPALARTDAPTGQDLITSAKKYLGVDYVWGGESLDEGGLDCSGLVQLAMKDIAGPAMPRTAREQQKVGELIPSLEQAKPGDLVFFNDPATHVGIYVGDGKMLDAPKPGKQVQIRDVYETPATIRRVLLDEQTPAAPTTATADINRATVDLLAALTAAGLNNGAKA